MAAAVRKLGLGGYGFSIATGEMDGKMQPHLDFLEVSRGGSQVQKSMLVLTVSEGTVVVWKGGTQREGVSSQIDLVSLWIKECKLNKLMQV